MKSTIWHYIFFCTLMGVGLYSFSRVADWILPSIFSLVAIGVAIADLSLYLLKKEIEEYNGTKR